MTYAVWRINPKISVLSSNLWFSRYTLNFRIINYKFADNIIKIGGGDILKINPDNRKDNVERIQRNISMTIRNMELADEMMEKTDDSKTKKELRAKNERREQALKGMRKEIKDEADARENNNY